MAFQPLPGFQSLSFTRKYICPHGDYVWYEFDIGITPPDCPTHCIPLKLEPAEDSNSSLGAQIEGNRDLNNLSSTPVKEDTNTVTITKEAQEYFRHLKENMDHDIFTQIVKASELYQEFLDEKRYSKASELAASIHEMFQTTAESLKASDDHEAYRLALALASYWKLNRDLYTIKEED
ncbi:hypothetical protein [Almyronema epifaneia]|uniref:Uncharacterized protein n=1 Tax=Almyronema epifaneia S1 TaxID=2991925 RepID=A0ABW6ICN0_9CYAN